MRFTLPEGTLVHVCGWPVALTQDTIIETNPGTWGLIQQDLDDRAANLATPRVDDSVGPDHRPEGYTR
jgi:hypothetical protein